MFVPHRITCLLLLCTTLHADGVNSLNLAVVYDEREYVVPKGNTAMSVLMRDLFGAQVTPILLPGNLALRMAFAFGVSADRIRRLEFPYSYYHYSSDDILYIAYKEKFFKNVNWRDWYVYVVSNTPQHLVLFIPCSYAHKHGADINGRVDVKKLGFDPKALESIVDELGLAEKAAGYTFNPEKVASSIKRVFLKSDKNPAEIITPEGTLWNMYFDGHGRAPEAGISPMTLFLKKRERDTYVKKSARIAGMPAHEFLKFMTDIPAHIIVYSTCFGGGMNADAINQLVSVAASIEQKKVAIAREKSTRAKIFPIIISIASGEQSIFAKDSKFDQFFDYVEKAFSTPIKTIEERKSLLQQAVTFITDDKPIILFPVRVKSSGAEKEIQRIAVPLSKPISKHVAQKSAVAPEHISTVQSIVQKPKAATAVAIAREKINISEHAKVNVRAKDETKTVVSEVVSSEAQQKVDTPQGFMYLIEPGYILGVDHDGQLVLRGSLVKSGGVLADDQKIVFKSTPESSIFLETDLVNKRLVFYDIVVPSFSLKISSDYIDFKEISIPRMSLAEFLTRSFSEHGRALRVTISSCTAKNGSLMPGVGADGLINVRDVELHVLPYYLEPERGSVVFTYGARWYVFRLSEDQKITLERLAVIDIPKEKGKQNEMRSRILRQLDFNDKLAHAVWNKNTTEVARFFGEPLVYGELVSRPLLKDALDVVTRDEETWEHVYNSWSGSQRENMENTLKHMGADADIALLRCGVPYEALPSKSLAGIRFIGVTPDSNASPAVLMGAIAELSGDAQAKAVASLSDEQKKSVLAAALSSDAYGVVRALIVSGVRAEASVPADVLARVLGGLSGELLTKVVSDLSDEQKRAVLQSALSLDEYGVATALIVLGVKPEASVPADVLVRIFSGLSDKVLARVVAYLSDELKEAVLASAFLSDAYGVARVLIVSGVRLEDAVPTDALLRIFNGLNDNEILSKVSDVRKKALLAAALSSSNYGIAAELIASGVKPEVDIPANGWIGILDWLYGDKRVKVIASLSDEKKKEILAVALSSSKYQVVAELIASGVKPEAEISANGWVEILDRLDGDKRAKVIASLSDEKKKEILAVALSSSKYQIAAELIALDVKPEVDIPANGWVEILDWLYGDKRVKVIASLSDEKKKEILAAAQTLGVSRVIEALTTTGVTP